MGYKRVPLPPANTIPFMIIWCLFFESPRPSLAKEGSTFLTKPLFPQGREDVTGYAIASARDLVTPAESLPARGWCWVFDAT